MQQLPEQGITDWVAKTKNLFSQCSGNEKSEDKVLAKLVPSKGHEKGSVLGLSPWLVDGYLHPPFTYYLPYLPYICICVQTFLSYKDISHTIFKCILMSELIFNLNTSAKPIPNYSHS